MDKNSYEAYYKGFLFCPTPNCNAHLVFVEGNVQVSHFRTWRRANSISPDTEDAIKGKHVKGCPYELSHEESEKNRRKYDPDYKYNVSDEHISSVLRRAYNAYINKSSDPESESKPNRNVTHLTNPHAENEVSGTAVLFGQGEDITNGREPRIPVRLIDNLAETDYFQVRCIIGVVSNVYLEAEYAYINLKTLQGNRVKIHFNEFFIVNNRAQFTLFQYLKDYERSKKENKQEIICCCIGEVKKTEKGIDIRPDRYSAFSLDNKKLYAIVHEVSNLFG